MSISQNMCYTQTRRSSGCSIQSEGVTSRVTSRSKPIKERETRSKEREERVLLEILFSCSTSHVLTSVQIKSTKSIGSRIKIENQGGQESMICQ